MRKLMTICLKCLLTTLMVLGVVVCPVICFSVPGILDTIWGIEGDDDEI